MKTETLLLMEGTPSLQRQVQDARCRHECSEYWDFNRFFGCRIESQGIREQMPFGVDYRQQWGCIAIDTSPLRACAEDNREPYASYILFAPGFWRKAWSVARLIAGSNPQRPAILIREQLAFGIFIFVAQNHRVSVRSEDAAAE